MQTSHPGSAAVPRLSEPSQAEPSTGSLSAALARAQKLLGNRPDLAIQQAEAILQAVPGHPEAELILGSAHYRLNDAERAAAVLRPLAGTQPRAAAVHHAWALAQAALGDPAGAIVSLRRALSLQPGLAQAWRAMGDLHVLAGDPAAADAAYAQHIRAGVHDPALMEAAGALCDGDLAEAERLLRAHLRHHPTDVAALRMLAEAGTRLGQYADAEGLLARCLDLAPSFSAARHNYAVVLFRQAKAAEAIPHLDTLLAEDPRNPNLHSMLAASLAMTGDTGAAIEAYERVLAAAPGQPKIWLSYGHALKTAGRRADCVRAYRKCLALAPGLGEAWWSLANLKTEPFSPADIAALRRCLAAPGSTVEDRFHLHYALGRALEQEANHAAAFTHYAEGARLRRGEIRYSADRTHAQLDRTRTVMTRAFFAERAGWGCQDAAPIFIVGLPRSGSTLIEQILSSHSLVEGTMELPEIANIGRDLGRSAAGDLGRSTAGDLGRSATGDWGAIGWGAIGWGAIGWGDVNLGRSAAGDPGCSTASEDRYPDVLAELDAATCTALGERFLQRTRIHRKSAKPFFIDKMPNNFVHAGLIHLILPNARIIDARRHPMAACFSAFKQHFARGQHFSYDLTELGRYYRDYAALMAHFDAVLPGRIHRVAYEDMVDHTERETRRLLAHCGLNYEPACLRFHENDRAVRTASSEQVRQPIFREGLDHWQNYAPWLEPLQRALSLEAPASASS